MMTATASEPSAADEDGLAGVAIEVRDLTKVYRIWKNPASRLKALLAAGPHQLATKILGRTNGFTRRLDQSIAGCFTDFRALKNVSFQVRRGECLGIIGYNGSGKSTLLQIVAGTTTPTSGQRVVIGRVTALLELGSGFNPEFTGRENVFLYGAILGFHRTEMQRRFPDIEAFAEIGDFIDQPVKTYSSGMAIRLAFSVVTQVDPDVIIIDEALSVGDAYFQHKSMQRTRQFREMGKSILLVSHSTGTIKTMCDRAIILENGALIREGPAAVVCDYYNALVAKKERDAEIRQIEKERGRIVTRSGNMQAVLGSIDLLDSNGQPTRAFTTGEKARISCAVEFRRTTDHPTVGILIRDQLGNDVFGTNTFYHKVETGRYPHGERAEFSFDIVLNLGVGRYSVSCAVHTREHHTSGNYDWQDNVVVFDVLPGNEPRAVGTSYLPVAIEVHRGSIKSPRAYKWGDYVGFDLDGTAARYKHEGWSIPEDAHTWTDGPEATLLFDLLASNEPRRIYLKAAALTSESLPASETEVLMDGHLLGKWKIGPLAEHVIEIPTDLLALPGRRTMTLRIRDPQSPKSLGRGDDERLLGLQVYRLYIE